jgi:predicted transcriptional regulator
MRLEIKLALLTRHMTLDDLARKIRRSKTLVSMILNERHAGWHHRRKIRTLLGLPDHILPDKRKDI